MRNTAQSLYTKCYRRQPGALCRQLLPMPATDSSYHTHCVSVVNVDAVKLVDFVNYESEQPVRVGPTTDLRCVQDAVDASRASALKRVIITSGPPSVHSSRGEMQYIWNEAYCNKALVVPLGMVARNTNALEMVLRNIDELSPSPAAAAGAPRLDVDSHVFEEDYIPNTPGADPHIEEID